jgi:hypothetical protein
MMSSTCFKHDCSSSRRRLYTQLCLNTTELANTGILYKVISKTCFCICCWLQFVRTCFDNVTELFSLRDLCPPHPQKIRSETYRGYVKLQIILNTVYNMIFT